MAVFRVAKMSDFTTMNNHHLRNRNLSLKAVGLLSKILSLPDKWDYSLRGLSKLNTDGIDGVRSAVKELEDAGYIIRRQLRDKGGRMSSSEYLVFEIPELAKPSLEKPTTAKPSAKIPSTETPMQLNTNQVIKQKENTLLINNPSIHHTMQWQGRDETDRKEQRELYREIIEENIGYAQMQKSPTDERLAEIVELMLDVICSNSKTIRINGEDMPHAQVKSRLLKLDCSHIEYVFDAMKKNPSEIRNIRAYLLTALYNASLTIDNYYTALVNHDFYGER